MALMFVFDVLMALSFARFTEVVQPVIVPALGAAVLRGSCRKTHHNVGHGTRNILLIKSVMEE
jgi:hypothetical protein